MKALVPREQLLVVKLEDGLDFTSICPFLGHDVPAQPYPRGNDPQEFKKMVQGHMAPGMKKGMAVIAGTVLPMLGLGIWLLVKRMGRL